MQRTIVRISGALVCSFFLIACGDSDSPTNPGGGNGGSGGGRTVKANPTFQGDIIEIFNRRGCSAGQCHGTSPGAGSLVLTADSAYVKLVGVPSAAEAAFERVVAGDATNSYLVMRLEGRQNVGSRMPLGGEPLDATDMGNIRNWITNGAPNN